MQVFGNYITFVMLYAKNNTMLRNNVSGSDKTDYTVVAIAAFIILVVLINLLNAVFFIF